MYSDLSAIPLESLFTWMSPNQFVRSLLRSAVWEELTHTHDCLKFEQFKLYSSFSPSPSFFIVLKHTFLLNPPTYIYLSFPLVWQAFCLVHSSRAEKCRQTLTQETR